MIEIEVKGGRPQVLAELIASTIDGEARDAGVAQAGQLVREQKEAAENRRPSWQQMETVNFQTLDEDEDWTDV